MTIFIKKNKSILIFIFSLYSLCLVKVGTSQAQEQALPADTAITSTHKIVINGNEIPYEVTAGTLPVYGEDGKPDAYVQYTYYRRTDIENVNKRPILFSFNGGPGTASLWMHLGYTSPKRLKVGPEGWPVQPYGVVDNHSSILDVADLVYVNPVNTGFSRIINDGKKEDFFGVRADIEYLADWIDLFISRYGRWDSPKYLMGESYGTTRVAGLAGELQARHYIYLNGVIFQGNCGIGLVNIESSALKLPAYTAAAWYHKQLPQDLQSQDLTELMPKVINFTINEYLPAVAWGGVIDDVRKQTIAKQVARYAGISEQFVLNYNLEVPASAFWKELLRDQGKTIGRLDTRYMGIDETNAGERPDYNAELKAWENAFTPAINKYIRGDLGLNPDLQFYVFGPVRPWERGNINVGDMLRQAMQVNPALHVLNQQGYYDAACDVLTAQYSLWHLDPRGVFKDRIEYTAYKSGHMLYIRKKMMEKGNDELRTFIKNTLLEEGQPVRYKQ